MWTCVIIACYLLYVRIYVRQRQVSRESAQGIHKKSQHEEQKRGKKEGEEEKH